MKILETIKRDHDQFRSLLEQLVATDNADHNSEERTALIHKIRDEVISHARAEEAVVYNGMRKADAPTDMVYHGFAEHAETEVLLHALTLTDRMSVEWKTLSQKLHDSLIHHVTEEETDLFPEVRAAFSEEEGKKMAERFLELKAEYKAQNPIHNAMDLIGNLVSTSAADDVTT